MSTPTAWQEHAAKALRSKVKERDLLVEVRALAEGLGWLVYHTWNSRHSPAGLPDLLMVKGHRLIVAELKTVTGKVSEAQRQWLTALARVQTVDAMVIRPGSDYSELIEVLR